MNEPGETGKGGPLIATAGAYPDIAISDYHGRETCPAPSISSSGLKKIVGALNLQAKGCSPRHYWEGSPLNPNRKPTVQTDALRIGGAFHDALLLPRVYADPAHYHFLPEGFSRKQTKAQAEAIADADAAAAAGLCVITAPEAEQIAAMVRAMREHPIVDSVLSDGVAEMTLAWQDAETGVWLRARPDWLPNRRHVGVNVKTTSDASFAGFQSDVTKYRYAQSAALEMDGIAAVYGSAPANYLHPVVEKPGTGWRPGDYLPVALWELPAEDIERGRWLNRQAIRLFADCLSADRWPSYADTPALCGTAGWLRKAIDTEIEKEAA